MKESKFHPDTEVSAEAHTSALEARHEFDGGEPDLVKLILQAQEGSRDAYLMLRLRYRPLMDASLARFVTDDMSLQDREDMREEAERVFLSAVTTYDTEQEGVDFGLYAKICLRNGLISERRSLQVRRRYGVVSLSPDEASVSEDPANALVEAERFHMLYTVIREHLSKFENRVWWMYVSGVEIREIAQSVGKDDKSVHNAIYRIRKKLRALLSTMTDQD